MPTSLNKAQPAFQYNPASPSGENDQFTHWKGLDRDIPDLSALILDFRIEPSDQPDHVLLIGQLHHDGSGARSDVVHRLHPTDWIVASDTADGGYEVMTNEELQALSGSARVDATA